jgi:hypothetical protein
MGDTMEIRSLGRGIEVEFDVRPTEHGCMVIHGLRGKGTYTVSCTCGGKTVSKTCTHPDGTPPSPTCDCTGPTPVVTC